MKTTVSLFIVFFISLAFYSNAQKLTKVWETSNDVLKTPESVIYDSENDVFYVSNVNGNPTEKDQNGFISILNTDGTYKTAKWIDGLHAPKGMAIFKGKLYVSDIDKLVEIDIKKGIVEKEYQDPSAVFLNDVAACGNGMIFVTDMQTKKIHVLNEGKFTVWLEDKSFENPNGLFTEKGKLYVGDNNIFEVDVKTKDVKKIIENAGGVDGLEKDNDGNFVFSNWPGKIWINKNGRNIKLHDSTAEEINTADIDFALKFNLVLVPTFFDNRVVAYKISE